jgi:hypothetical protein
MKTAIVFFLAISLPVSYLWERALSFRQCQTIGRLQEERHHLQEVCDSLQAGLANARSDYRIGCLASRMGMATKYAAVKLVLPVAAQPTASRKRQAASGKRLAAGPGTRGKSSKSPEGQLTSLAPKTPKKSPGEM